MVERIGRQPVAHPTPSTFIDSSHVWQALYVANKTASKGEALAFLQAVARGNCMSRSITDMIADAVVRLFSSESVSYTGQALILDGGLMAAPRGQTEQ